MKRALFTLVFFFVAVGASAATIVIVNKDAAGVGFNDVTPAAPVGGNPGTTLGQQRLNAFQYAAGIWGAKLNSPITIKIAANFGPLGPCTTNSGVIGSAGPTTFLRDFPNAPRAGTFFPVAQASALANTDFPTQFGIADGASITASFNSLVGTAGCLTGTSFYLGLDANEAGKIDLVTTLLHEFGHGLGFSGITDLSTGAMFTNRPDIFAVNTRDNTVMLNWHVMSDAQRLASSTNTGNVVFDGANTTSAAATVLSAGKDGSQHPQLFTPNPQQGGSSVFHFNTAASPNQLMEPSINADLTHNVDVPNDLTTKAFQDMGWPLLSGLAAPATVTASATGTTSVAISWAAVPSATTYEVHRSLANNRNTFTQIASCNVALTNCVDNTAASGSAYVYKVRAGSSGAFSVTDLATTVVFTDPTLNAGVTLKAAHLNELRTAANAVRTLAGLAGGTYTDPGTLTSANTCRKAHVDDLRTELNSALTTLGLANVANPGITANVTLIQATHINALRLGVQ